MIKVCLRGLLCTVVLLMLAAAGCGKKPKEVVPAEIIQCDFTGSCNGISAAGKISASNGTVNVKMSRPDELKGMELVVKSDGVNVKYSGMNISLDKERYPSAAFVCLLRDALFDFDENGCSAVETRGGYVISGSGEEGNYELTLDGDMKIVGLKTDYCSIEFYNK